MLQTSSLHLNHEEFEMLKSRFFNPQMEQILNSIRDENLRLCLSFGVGIHHAGLVEKDRKVVEELFVNQKIQVMFSV